MIYGYLRVSTAVQAVENQRFEILGFCRSRGMRVREWISETVCGAAKIEERELGRALAKMRRGDVLIATELSRLGRNLLQVMSLLNVCFERGVRVLTVKERYELGDNLGSKILAFAFSLSAEVERQLISQRTTEALARLKSKGKKLGRPPGSRNKRTKLDGREAFIFDSLSSGVSKISLSRQLGVHWNSTAGVRNGEEAGLSGKNRDVKRDRARLERSCLHLWRFEELEPEMEF